MAKGSFEGFPSPRPNKGGTNTGDATAVAGDLGTGKTAYAVGVKITGNGANFGNAAVGDVGSGKTFSSSNGTLITGTGANFGNAAVGDVVSGQTFSSASGTLLAGTGANAKAYASGSSTSSSGTLTFTNDAGGSVSSQFLNITGLNFSNGIGMIIINTSASLEQSIYNHNLLTANSKILVYNGTGVYWRLTGNATVTTTSFQIPFNGASISVSWEAWGL